MPASIQTNLVAILLPGWGYVDAKGYVDDREVFLALQPIVREKGRRFCIFSNAEKVHDAQYDQKSIENNHEILAALHKLCPKLSMTKGCFKDACVRLYQRNKEDKGWAMPDADFPAWLTLMKNRLGNLVHIVHEQESKKKCPSWVAMLPWRQGEASGNMTVASFTPKTEDGTSLGLMLDTLYEMPEPDLKKRVETKDVSFKAMSAGDFSILPSSVFQCLACSKESIFMKWVLWPETRDAQDRVLSYHEKAFTAYPSLEQTMWKAVHRRSNRSSSSNNSNRSNNNMSHNR